MIRAIASILLSAFILAGSLSIPVYKHTCHLFDRTEIAVLNQKACCSMGEMAQEEAIDFKCCTLDQLETDLSFESVIEFPQNFQIALPESDANIYNKVAHEFELSLELPVQRPPPLANREILSRFQIFLI